MELFIARQPILNVHLNLFAYELLYRGKSDISMAAADGDKATATLLSSAFLTKEIEEISSYRPCFINFTQELLERNLPASFPKSQIVVEVLEDVKPTQKVLQVCRQLREDGYRIALDDFVFDQELLPLVELADIVKIDVRLTPPDTIIHTLKILAGYKVKLLAEKVESQAEYEKARKLGFSYFQGYFFSRPENIKIQELSAAKVNLLQLLQEISRKQTSLDRLHEIISHDIAISYKLFRFLNSAYFGRVHEITDVKHAIVYLGEIELRRFLMLLVISEVSTEKPAELVRLVLGRAKFCELLCKASRYKEMATEAFMMGLFSALDVMLDATMAKALENLPLHEEVKQALVDGEGSYFVFLQVAKAYEQNLPSLLESLLSHLEVDPETANKSYLESIRYVSGLY